MRTIINRLAWFASTAVAYWLLTRITGGLDLPIFKSPATFLWFLAFLSGFSMAIKRICFPGWMLEKKGKPKEAEMAESAEVEAEQERVEKVEKVESVEDHESFRSREQQEWMEAMNAKKSAEEDGERAEVQCETVSKAEISERVVAKSEEAEVRLESNKRHKPESKKKSPPNFIEKFFSENLLAKVGGIMLFLGVLFFLHLLYTKIGPVGKLIIGFAVGFAIYGMGLFLHKKKLAKEGLILIGTGILINYLVILAGRYLIGDTATDSGLLSEGITLLFLIMNTVLAVVTSLVYESEALLFFSFVIAYLNPFLIQADWSKMPFAFMGYASVISLGAIAISQFTHKRDRKSSEYLLDVGFAGGNILMLALPLKTTVVWLSGLGVIALLSLIVILMAYRQKINLGRYFMATYLVLIVFMGIGNNILGDLFHSGEVIIGYTAFLALMLLGGVLAFVATAGMVVLSLAIVPLAIVLGLSGLGMLPLGYITPYLAVGMVIYMVLFLALNKRIQASGEDGLPIMDGFFIVIGLFAMGMSFATNLLSPVGVLPLEKAIGIVFASLLFVVFSYFFSAKKGLEYLYSMGTLFGIVMLLTMVEREGTLLLLSVAGIVALVALNMLTSLINRQLSARLPANLIAGLVSGALFGTGAIYYFGTLYFPGTALGLSFLGFAVLYFILGSVFFFRLREKSIQAKGQNQKSEGDLIGIEVMLGLALSLFSLSIAFLFSGNPEIIATVWLFEATLMFHFARRTKVEILTLAGLILMAIGLFKLFGVIGLTHAKDYVMLVPIALILGSLGANLKMHRDTEELPRFIYNGMHIAATILLGVLIGKLIPDPQNGWLMVGMTAYLLVLGVMNVLIKPKSVSINALPIFGMAAIGVIQIFILPSTFHRLEEINLEALKWLQHGNTALLAISFLFLSRSSEEKERKQLKLGLLLYLFTITTQYAYYLFNENTFVITIYWAIVAFLFTGRGIIINRIWLRTAGLYFLTLTISKVLIYDIWSGLADAVSRIVALMLIGILMIGLSILYTKKYKKDLKGEFAPENLLEI